MLVNIRKKKKRKEEYRRKIYSFVLKWSGLERASPRPVSSLLAGWCCKPAYCYRRGGGSVAAVMLVLVEVVIVVVLVTVVIMVGLTMAVMALLYLKQALIWIGDA